MVISMKQIHRWLAWLMCLVTLVGTLALPVGAQSAPDLTKPVSLTVHHVYNPSGENIPLTGVEFSLYLVAKMGQGGALTAEPAFSRYVTGGSQADWEKTLNRLISDFPAGVTPVDKAKTDKNGDAVFPSEGKTLVPGLYYVPGTKTVKNGWIYTTSPFLVSLPNYFDGQWVYAQQVNAKSSREADITDIEVVKVWKDSCHPKRRPEEITVTLLCDGEIADLDDAVVTLSKDNNWKYTWSDLDATCEWTVTEERVKGYNNPKVKKNGTIITVTNTCNRPEHPRGGKLPQTGQLWWPVPVLLLAGLVLVIVGLLRRKEDNYEA